MIAATPIYKFDFPSMMKTLLVAFVVTLVLSANTAWAANRYVRAGATGAGNGTDWSNAYAALPDTLVRGDTYYIAGGSYPAYTFNDPQSGSLVTTIKKAIVSDHGTDAGWQSGFGSAQATFNSTLQFQTGNYVLDGQYRNESNWFDGASYGIRIAHNNQDQNIIISGGTSSSNITVKHVFVDAIYQNLPTSTTLRRYAIDTDTYGGSVATGLVFTRMYVYGGNNVWFLRTTNGAIVEYSASDGVSGQLGQSWRDREPVLQRQQCGDPLQPLAQRFPERRWHGVGSHHVRRRHAVLRQCGAKLSGRRWSGGLQRLLLEPQPCLQQHFRRRQGGLGHCVGFRLR